MIIVGRAGSGKDTIAELLKLDLPRYAFADALKEAIHVIQSDGVDAGMEYLSDISGVSVDELQGILPVVQTIHTTVLDGKQRKHLQDLGDGIRALFSDFWVQVLVNKIIVDNPKGYIVTDCRYKNELDALQQLDVGEPWYRKSIFVQTNKKERVKRMKDRDGSCNVARLNGQSEESVDELKQYCTYKINNSKDITDLMFAVNKIKEDILCEELEHTMSENADD